MLGPFMAASGTRTQKIIMQQIEEFKASQAKLKTHSSPDSQQLQPSVHEAVGVNGLSSPQPSNSQLLPSLLLAGETAELGPLGSEQNAHVGQTAQQPQSHEAEPVHPLPGHISLCNGASAQETPATSIQPCHPPVAPTQPNAVSADASKPGQTLQQAQAALSLPPGQVSLSTCSEPNSQPSQPVSPQRLQHHGQQHLPGVQQLPLPQPQAQQLNQHQPILPEQQSQQQLPLPQPNVQQQQYGNGGANAEIRQEPDAVKPTQSISSLPAPEPVRSLDPARALQELRQAIQAAGACSGSIKLKILVGQEIQVELHCVCHRIDLEAL